MQKPVFSQYLVIPATKPQLAILKWVRQACSRDESHPSLTGINFTEKQWIATDGIRAHIADIGPQMHFFPTDGIYHVRAQNGGLIVLEKSIDTKFPDINPILESARKGGLAPQSTADRYVCAFALQGKYIFDALNFGNSLSSQNGNGLYNLIELRGGPLYIQVGCDIEGVTLTALVMPMRTSSYKPHNDQTAVLIPVEDAK